MKARLQRLAKLLAFPALYLFSLAFFGYLTFPFDAVGSRLVAEFDKSQRSGGRPLHKPPMELELGELDGYWLSGVEVRGAKLTFPPDTKSKGSLGRGPLPAAASAEDDDAAAPKPTVVAVEHAHARLRLLPLLLGRMRIDFGADVFGGEVFGTLPYGGSSGDVAVEIEGVKLGEVKPLGALLGLPVQGEVNGHLQVEPAEGKFSKGNGKLELRIGRVVVGDGKATVQGVALPAAELGDLTITGEAKDGVLTIEEITTSGKDLELQGEGRIRMREPWLRSQADIYLMFRFADAYRNTNDTTRSLLGAPGSKSPALIEFDAKVKRSKREDGFYSWHIHGPLGDLKFDPQGAQSKGGRSRPSATPPKPTAARPANPALGARVARRTVAGMKGRPVSEGPAAAPARTAELPTRPSPAAPEPPPAEAEAEAETEPSPPDDGAENGATEPEHAEEQPGGDDEAPEAPASE